MGLLRFLIISIAIWYIIRTLVRIFLPMLFQGMMKKTQQQGAPQNRSQPYHKRQEGAIKVEYMPPTVKSAVPDSEGEFVEYEELKK
ncbi:MAG: DUF4834 domain-containing protein [Sphingobacteriaceae bacterium]